MIDEPPGELDKPVDLGLVDRIDLGPLQSRTLPLPEERPYNPEEDREKIRGQLAQGLFLLLAVVAVLVIVAAWNKAEHVTEMVGVLSTVAGIFGTAAGFYFGSTGSTLGKPS